MDKIDIRPLKAIAPTMKDPVKTLILQEPDFMEPQDYASKCATWLKIMEIKKESP